MPLISPHAREQIRAASDVVEVIGAYVPLRKAGANFVALCPFHKEKTPSFHVSPSRQAYHCFGCHKGGDVFRFVQEFENVSFLEAAKRLAQRAGIALEFEETAGQREDRALGDRMRELHEQIAQRWQQGLISDAQGQPARDYLEKRGVSEEAKKLFRIGYAPDAWDDTVNWARSKGWDLPLVEQSGLIIAREPSEPSRGYYDRFRGRLMFPICDEQGRVVGFSGRTLKSDEQGAKYVNSPETPIFVKSRVLYGLDKARRAILDLGSVIVCEGQLDLIACFMAGVQNIVAPQGTALTAEHLRILRRYAQEAVLCFDSDAAGQKAAARVLDELLASGLAIRVITVPAPHDPDSFIQAHGAEAFRELTRGARDFFEFYLQFLCSQQDLKTDRGRLTVLNGMAEALAKIGNEVLWDLYAQRTAMSLAAHGSIALTPDAVRKEFRKHALRTTRSPAPGRAGQGPNIEVAPERPVPPSELRLLQLLLLNDGFVGWVALHLDPAWIQDGRARILIERCLRLHQEGTWHSAAAFLGEIEDDALRGLASEAISVRREIPNQEQQLRDVVQRIRDASLEREKQQLLSRIELPAVTPQEREALQREINRLRMLKASPLTARPMR